MLSRRRWLSGLIIGWAVVLVALAFLASGRAPTVKEQVSAGVSRDEMARGTALALRDLASAEGVVVTATGFELAESCKVTPVRSGVRYTQTVRVYTAQENVVSVMDRLYRALRTDYDLVNNGAGGYAGHAEPFVTALLAPTLDAPVTWRLDTGCRPADEPTVSVDPPATPGLMAATVLPGPWLAKELDCGDGRTGRAYTATGPGTMPDPGWKLYAGESGGSAWVAGTTPEGTLTVTEAGDGEVTVRETVGCD